MLLISHGSLLSILREGRWPENKTNDGEKKWNRMNATLRPISEEYFLALDAPGLFYDGRMKQCFGLVEYGALAWGLAWSSELVAPVITQISQSIHSVGIDLNFAILDLAAGAVLYQRVLDYWYFRTIVLGGYILIIHELGIVQVDMATFTEVAEWPLPDIFEDIKADGTGMVVTCMDGSIARIENVQLHGEK